MAKKEKEENSETVSKFYDLQDETIEKVNNLIDKLALPFNLKVKIIGNSKQKTVIKLSKINDINQFLTGFDMLIMINEEYLEAVEDESSDILIYQELDRLNFDISKGTFKIIKYPLQTTAGVLKKWGIDAVAKANQLSELYSQQKSDGKPFDKKEAEKKIAKNSKNSVSFD